MFPAFSVTEDHPSLVLRRNNCEQYRFELKNILNMQVTQITRLLDVMMDQRNPKAIARFSRVVYPPFQMLQSTKEFQDHVVISGGLGSSKYIQQEIFNHITKSKIPARCSAP